MDLDGKLLSTWLAEQSEGDFPTGFNYRNNYSALANHLSSIHKEVTPTSIHTDGGYLTDHGPDHIRKLVERISALLRAGSGAITPYEAYLLLAAVQFHDVGNIFGREKHEEKAADVMSDAGNLLPPDNIERRFIYTIASAHGGKEKDKLSTLPAKDHLRGFPVRPQLLAAILKFGDELAEDSERGARYSFDKGLIAAESEIFHAYALALNSVSIDKEARDVQLKFDMTRATALKKFKKKNKTSDAVEVYLIDEIMSRTMKTHFERVYCSLFMRPIIDLTSISVSIEISDDRGFNVLKKIVYRLQEAGYPDTDKNIYALCPELMAWENNGALDGKKLAITLGGLDG